MHTFEKREKRGLWGLVELPDADAHVVPVMVVGAAVQHDERAASRLRSSQCSGRGSYRDSWLPGLLTFRCLRRGGFRVGVLALVRSRTVRLHACTPQQLTAGYGYFRSGTAMRRVAVIMSLFLLVIVCARRS